MQKRHKKPQKEPLLISPSNMALCTDLYELTMAAAYFENRIECRSSFELFVRALPSRRSYLVAAGLEQVVQYLRDMSFDSDAVDYLRSLDVFRGVSRDFFDYLRAFKFDGDVDAIPEGTLAFAGEPLVRVTAPVIQAQIVETYLLSTVTFQTLVASKAARVVSAARGRPVVDFGTRRAHGPLAGLWAARASYIAGCAGTSNVLAGRLLGIPVMGTCAHSWVMTFDSEMESFRKFRRVFPGHAVLLIDTYDTVEGAEKAVATGRPLAGVRLDSGDLVSLSRKVRKILDRGGLKDARIMASGDLNEYRLERILSARAPLDAFGVGTEMVTSRDEPTLSTVYKLVEQSVGDRKMPRFKASERKSTYPGVKQVFRTCGRDGRFEGDVIASAEEDLPGTALIEPVMRAGKMLRREPGIEEIRQRCLDQLSRLPAKYKRLRKAARYPVRVSACLKRMRNRARAQHEKTRPR